MNSKMGLVAAALLVAGGGSAIAMAATQGEQKIGRSGTNDARVATVTATAVPESPAGPAPETPPERAAADLRPRMALLRDQSSKAPAPPKQIADIAEGTPILKDAQVVELINAGGVEPMWLLAGRRGAVMLADVTEGVARGSMFDAQSLAEGKLMRTYEAVPGQPDAVVVSGLLADDAQDVRVKTERASVAVRVTENFYSVVIDRAKQGLPQQLVWADAAGAHELAIPLSPDVTG